jgi:hypothetical protein
MKRMDYFDGQTRPSTASQDAYDNIFVDQLKPSYAKANATALSRPTRRATKAPRMPARLIADDGYVV